MLPRDRTEHPWLFSTFFTYELALPNGNAREIRCPSKSPVRVMMSAVSLLVWSKTTSSASCSVPQEQVTAS